MHAVANVWGNTWGGDGGPGGSPVNQRLQALKSRLVGGVIFDVLPVFIGLCYAQRFCPPTCPPILTLRSLTISHDGRLLQAYDLAESGYLVGYWTLAGILTLSFPNFTL